MDKVKLVKCDSYNTEEVYSAVKSAIDAIGGISAFVRPKQKVLLKPNVLGAFKPEQAATTHPEIVRAVIKLVKEAGAIPFIGESPGFGSLERFSKPTGIKKVSEEENVPLVEFLTPKDVEFHGAKRFKTLTIAAEILEYDFIVNLPKFKTHGLMGTTGAVKNLFGCVPGILKSQYHFKIKTREYLIDLLHDLANFIKPGLSIMDAVWAMEGEGGPSQGTPKHMGIVAVSTDPFLLDDVFDKIINGVEVQGFSCPDFKKIENMSEGIYHLPFPFMEKYLKKWFSEKPVINSSKCINCGVCIKVCAATALQNGNKAPIFNYDKCIRCFCCQEMCPERAIRIKRNILGDFISRLLSRF